MRKEEIKDFTINGNSLVTVTKMNHITEVQYMQKRNNKAIIKKLNDKEYVLLETGEVKEFMQHADTRTAHLNSLYRTMKQMRYLINHNFVGADNEAFITLTLYGHLQTNDPKKLYVYFDKFMKRLRYRYSETSIDYINVVEPHASGNFHCHVLLKFNDMEKHPLDKQILKDIWGLGEQVDVRNLDDVDNVGAYVSSYLTDMPVEDIPVEKLIEGKVGTGVKEVDGKVIVKGARLHYYPKGIRIYRPSGGIKKPTREQMTYLKAKEYIGTAIPTYSKTIEIDLPNDKTSILSYEYYNLKRKK